MELIIYENIPCPVLLKEEPNTFLVLFKGEQKWLYKCSLGYGEIEKDEDGIFYLFNGELHRESGPACEYSGGDKIWYQNGKRHRKDGPAWISLFGDKYWYQNGKLHRENGPAVEYSDGLKEWWIENLEYSEKDYFEKIEEMK